MIYIILIIIILINLYIWGICKMLVPESGRNSQSGWGPPCGEFISHISSFLLFNSRWLKIKQESRWKHNLLRMVWIVCFWPVSDLFLTCFWLSGNNSSILRKKIFVQIPHIWSMSQYDFVLQSLYKACPNISLYYKACTGHVPELLYTTMLAQSMSQY